MIDILCDTDFCIFAGNCSAGVKTLSTHESSTA